MGNKQEKRAALERQIREREQMEQDAQRSRAAAQAINIANNQNKITMLPAQFATIDCACVIHGDAYGWDYVDRLYRMLTRNLTPIVRLHVYTEESRPVPHPYIKHSLIEWERIKGPKRAWWYKMQLFNTEHHSGPLLYFDLDTVVVGNLDWIWGLPTKFFWGIKDFRYLWRPTNTGINSSVMWWDTTKFQHIWHEFIGKDINHITRIHQGDQDFITEIIKEQDRRFFDIDRIKSWRWQCLNGGFDFKTRRYRAPNTGTQLNENISVLVFHGDPKPDKCNDAAVLNFWQ